MHRTAVKKVVQENVLDANDTLAQANRDRFDAAGTYVVNMMSSPGAGKTALLEHTLWNLRGKVRLGILEGDVQTTLDADRLARFHVPLVQVNTDPGFGGGMPPGRKHGPLRALRASVAGHRRSGYRERREPRLSGGIQGRGGR